MIERIKLGEIEWVARSLMALILITASTSKFFGSGGFKAYYSELFQNPDLRINMPAGLIDTYLTLIPFIEMTLGLCLLLPMLKRYTVWAWYAFMASLLIGHYILQEWSVVNQMLAYFFLGFLVHALPTRAEVRKN